MPFIVQCTHLGRAKLDRLSQTVDTYEQGDKLREEWLRKGAARVEVREVPRDRDWNNTADPAVRDAERAERDAARVF